MRYRSVNADYFISNITRNKNGSTRIELTQDLKLAMSFGPNDTINGYTAVRI